MKLRISVLCIGVIILFFGCNNDPKMISPRRTTYTNLWPGHISYQGYELYEGCVVDVRFSSGYGELEWSLDEDVHRSIVNLPSRCSFLRGENGKLIILEELVVYEE